MCSLTNQPSAPDDRLLRLPNVVLTLHIAWLATGMFDCSLMLALEDCRRF
jgi:lactate dehydrogenase-like 2-hydroxyacid dehydrogenase